MIKKSNKEVEILVVGLGAMGSAALYYLARQGAAPVGLEQHQIDHAFGSSHGSSRAFRTFYYDPLYVNLAEAARPLWRELEALSGEQLLTLKGWLGFTQAGNDYFEQSQQVMDELSIPCEALTAEEVRTRFPALRLPEGATACYTPRAGFLDPSRCVWAHVSQALRFGATVHGQVCVHHIDLSRERPELETSAGRYHCARLVVTPGPWAGQILADLSLPLQVTRQQKFYFRPEDPRAYQPDRLPVYGDYDTLFYGFPHYGPGLKVANDNLGQPTTADAVDRTLDLAERDRLQAWLETIMPGVELTFAGGATCMYTVTPDRDFLLGPHPQHPNVFVGAGFSGHGFKFSTLIGQTLAELVLAGTTSQPIERFRLDRFD